MQRSHFKSEILTYVIVIVFTFFLSCFQTSNPFHESTNVKLSSSVEKKRMDISGVLMNLSHFTLSYFSPIWYRK